MQLLYENENFCFSLDHLNLCFDLRHVSLTMLCPIYNVYIYSLVSYYIIFKCKQLRFVSLHWNSNSSTYYNFKDVSWQLQITFRKKLCAANDHISSTLWQMVLAFWPQFSLHFANQLPAAWEYTFSWAKYSIVDTNLTLLAFSSFPIFGHMSIENARFLLFMANI